MTQNTNLMAKDWVQLSSAKKECYYCYLKFMKHLTTVAVSIITYLKRLFPDANYLTEDFKGTEIKILKSKCDNVGAQFVSQGLLNAFDAIEKKYLQKLALCFYKDSDLTRNNLIESFWFQFNYIDNEVSMHTKNPNNQEIKKRITPDDIQFATTQMIRCCTVILQCSQKLPENVHFAIRLYYNDDAPEDYQAPGYKPGDDDNLVELADKLSLGVVKTRFHELVAWTCCNDVQHGTNEAILSDTASQCTQDRTQQHSKTVNKRTNNEAKCPCNSYNDPQWALLDMLQCTFCNTLQHAVCFGVVSNIQRHCCCVCADEDKSRLPTDDKLAVNVTAKLRQSLCMYRRTLWWCLTSSKSRISGSELAKHFSIGRADAMIILQQMQTHNVIDARIDDGISQPRQILIDGFRTVLKEYFKDLGDNYSDVTLELVSNCTSTSREHPTAEVVESNQEVSLIELSSPEGMPLSGPHNPVPNLDNKMKSRKKKTAVNGNEKCGYISKKVKRAPK